MKKILILFIISFFFACNNKSSKKEKALDSNIQKKESNIAIDKMSQFKDYNKDLLNGVWAENEDENALFFIESDSINYFEYEDSIYPVSLKRDTLVITYKDYIFKGKILTLTNDSLVYEADTRIIRLYKRVQ